MATIHKCLFNIILISALGASVLKSQGISPAHAADFREKPGIKWIFSTRAPLFASPVASGEQVYIGSLDSTLYAVDIRSGKRIWEFHTNGELRSGPCIDGDNLFLNGGDGTLYALNRKSGKVVWRFTTEGEEKYDFADYFQSTPVLKDKVIFFGSGDGNFYAVDKERGMLVWKFKTGGIIHNTAAISGNKIFFGSFDGFVYALDLKTGELIWKFKTVGHRYFPRGEVQGSPCVYKDLVITGARDYNIYALDQDRGYCHWNKSFTNGWALNNNMHDSILYTGTADERVLIAADPLTGREIWKRGMEFLVFGNNAYSENMLYVGTTIGKLHGISLKSGNTVWSFETESYRERRAAYFKPDDTYRDDIYSIIKSNEQFLEVECELGGIFSTPLTADGYIIFSSTNGKLYCLAR